MFTGLELDRGDFRGRLHFSELSKDRGPRVETAARWLDSFFGTHIDHVSFKATFALHDGPRPLPYPGQDGYQRHLVHATSSNILGHIRYVLRGFNQIDVRSVFDHTGNARERMYSNWGLDTARFRINQRRRKGKTGYPEAVLHPIKFQSSAPAQATTLDEAINAEFLQLTDLLLGSAAQALNFLPTEGRQGRRQLARTVTEEMASRFGRPAYVFSRRQRHFSVSLYPDSLGRMYAANPVRRPVQLPVEQLQLGPI